MSNRRNLDAGAAFSTFDAGLQATGNPHELDRDLTLLRPELRPRSYEVNAGRTTGEYIPPASDYARPGDPPPPAGSPTSSEDCGCG